MVLRGSVSGWRRLPAGILKEMSEPAVGQGGRETLIIHHLKILNYKFSIRSKNVVQNTVMELPAALRAPHLPYRSVNPHSCSLILKKHTPRLS